MPTRIDSTLLTGLGDNLVFNDYLKVYKEDLCLFYKDTMLEKQNVDELVIKKKTNKSYRGDTIYKEIVNSITNTKDNTIKLYDYQKRFALSCIKSTLPKIYGDDWEVNQLDIMDKHSLNTFSPETFFITARRMGKTLTLALIAVIYALKIPSDNIRAFRISVFSTTRDASYRFIDECKSALRCVNGLEDYDIKILCGRIIFTNSKNRNDVREIIAFCGRGEVSFYIFFYFLFVCLFVCSFVRSFVRLGWILFRIKVTKDKRFL